MPDFRSKTSSPGFVNQNSRDAVSKESLRLEQLIPANILNNSENLEMFMKAYYEFMNLDNGYTFLEEKEVTYVGYVDSSIGAVVFDTELSQVVDTDDWKYQGVYKDYFLWTDDLNDLSDAQNAYVKQYKNSSLESSITFQFDVGAGGYFNYVVDVERDPSDTAISSHVRPDQVLSTKLKLGPSSYSNPNMEGVAVTYKTKVLRFVVGANPSYVLNNIEQAMDIDETTSEYINLMQKELAPIVPSNSKIDKRNLLKLIVNFYLVRGTDDSIKAFFRIFFNEQVEVTYPWDETFRLSEGDWDDVSQSYVNKQSQLSSVIKLQDSDRYQKYSYVVKSSLNISEWDYIFERLVHPAGTKYFGEVSFNIAAVANPQITKLTPPSNPEWSYRSGILNDSLSSQMPGIQSSVYQGRFTIVTMTTSVSGVVPTVAAVELDDEITNLNALLTENASSTGSSGALELEGTGTLTLE